MVEFSVEGSFPSVHNSLVSVCLFDRQNYARCKRKEARAFHPTELLFTLLVNIKREDRQICDCTRSNDCSGSVTTQENVGRLHDLVMPDKCSSSRRKLEMTQHKKYISEYSRIENVLITLGPNNKTFQSPVVRKNYGWLFN